MDDLPYHAHLPTFDARDAVAERGLRLLHESPANFDLDRIAEAQCRHGGNAAEEAKQAAE